MTCCKRQLQEFFRLKESIGKAWRQRLVARVGSTDRGLRHQYIRCLCRRAREARYLSGCYPELKPPQGVE